MRDRRAASLDARALREWATDFVTGEGRKRRSRRFGSYLVTHVGAAGARAKSFRGPGNFEIEVLDAN